MLEVAEVAEIISVAMTGDWSEGAVAVYRPAGQAVVDHLLSGGTRDKNALARVVFAAFCGEDVPWGSAPGGKDHFLRAGEVLAAELAVNTGS